MILKCDSVWPIMLRGFYLPRFSLVQSGRYQAARRGPSTGNQRSIGTCKPSVPLGDTGKFVRGERSGRGGFVNLREAVLASTGRAPETFMVPRRSTPRSSPLL